MTVEKEALLFLKDKERKPKLSPSSRLGHIATALRSEYVWWVICLLCAGIYAWADRHAMNPDGLAYLEIASQSLKSGPSNLVNGYWSPLYPSVIGLTFAIVRPSSPSEFPTIQLANFVVFCVVLLCFRFFITSWNATHQNRTESEHCEWRDDLTPFCFGVFLWFMMEIIDPGFVTPDLCVTAVAFLAAGICCQICRRESSRWRDYVALGAALGLGYYAKAAMFPVALMLLALLFVLGKSARLKVALACLVFLPHLTWFYSANMWVT